MIERRKTNRRKNTKEKWSKKKKIRKREIKTSSKDWRNPQIEGHRRHKVTEEGRVSKLCLNFEWLLKTEAKNPNKNKFTKKTLLNDKIWEHFRICLASKDLRKRPSGSAAIGVKSVTPLICFVAGVFTTGKGRFAAVIDYYDANAFNASK